MRAPYNFIVEPLKGKRYDNTKKGMEKDKVNETYYNTNKRASGLCYNQYV